MARNDKPEPVHEIARTRLPIQTILPRVAKQPQYHLLEPDKPYYVRNDGRVLLLLADDGDGADLVVEMPGALQDDDDLRVVLVGAAHTQALGTFSPGIYNHSRSELRFRVTAENVNLAVLHIGS